MRKLHEAVLARLQTILPAGEVFQLGQVPVSAERYVVVHVARDREVARFMQWPTREVYDIVINSYGLSVTEAQWRQERVMEALDRWVPVVDGYRALACRHGHSQAVDVDDSVSPPLFFGSDHFTVRLDPA